eukprot:TRINITY_DN32435_c0_g1_i1.p1 TRINITY_DN32435_c0_g1~~TRINITY_DN32435_c0_g1_i1.p1  ORF type:complete len:257 (+),score=38.29 TRINITY_DN32435_c0_g1_i1:68-838(+)
MATCQAVPFNLTSSMKADTTLLFVSCASPRTRAALRRPRTSHLVVECRHQQELGAPSDRLERTLAASFCPLQRNATFTDRWRKQLCRGAWPRSADGQPAGPDVAEIGDMVTLNFWCKTEAGVVLESSEDKEPLSFEVGLGRVVGNPLFRDFDEAVRGLAVGEKRVMQSKAGDRMEELVFDVPRDHEEITKLSQAAEEEGEGPLREGSVVVLSNGSPAIITSVTDSTVRIDANHPLAESLLIFEVEVVDISKKQAAA